MTERRSHWDASLISAVLADLRDVYDSGYGEEQAFRIIAAVEDWYRERADELSVVDVIWGKARLAQAEAAVQRVRELPILGKAPQGNTALRGYNDGWNSCRMATLRALDGDA